MSAAELATFSYRVLYTICAFDGALVAHFEELATLDPHLAERLIATFGDKAEAMKWLSRRLPGREHSALALLSRGQRDEALNLLEQVHHGCA